MHVFKKFVKYYKPYQSVFWMDMFCALLVSACLLYTSLQRFDVIRPIQDEMV